MVHLVEDPPVEAHRVQAHHVVALHGHQDRQLQQLPVRVIFLRDVPLVVGRVPQILA